MISFVSLFLGLAVGVQTVSVQVAEPVTRVEIRLDGETILRMEGPPWDGQIDLGSALVPHSLEAVAYDSRGVELDRASQWLNLPRQPAEITILLERDPTTGRSAARVSWESLTGEEPSEVKAIFDGQPLAVPDPQSIPLPAFDPEALHFLRVEMEFAGFVGSSAEITFGGTYTDRVNTELTAIPIHTGKRHKSPDPDSLQGVLRVRGESPRIAAVEKGSAEMLIVRDRGAWSDLRKISSQVQAFAVPNRFGYTRRQWYLPDRPGWSSWSFRLVWPMARRLDSGAGPYDLFPNSHKLSASNGTLHGWLVTLEQPAELEGPQRLADAVAIAGVTAAASNRRRGVLLLLGDHPEDKSEITPAMARRYLESLRVPLFVWTIDPSSTGTGPWGPAVDVSQPRLMQLASLEIFASLDHQRVIWLEGFHLLHEISVSPTATDVELVTAH